jgi:DNA-binding NarL/FixJ family response regulator
MQDRLNQKGSKASGEAVNHLSERERAVLSAAAKGKQYKMIADELGISRRTVEVHITNARHKLGARNITEAVTIFLQLHGIAESPKESF